MSSKSKNIWTDSSSNTPVVVAFICSFNPPWFPPQPHEPFHPPYHSQSFPILRAAKWLVQSPLKESNETQRSAYSGLVVKDSHLTCGLKKGNPNDASIRLSIPVSAPMEARLFRARTRKKAKFHQADSIWAEAWTKK